MSVSINIECPIDGLTLGVISQTYVDVSGSMAVGWHVHSQSDVVERTCTNGHTWSIKSVDIIQERTA